MNNPLNILMMNTQGSPIGGGVPQSPPPPQAIPDINQALPAMPAMPSLAESGFTSPPTPLVAAPLVAPPVVDTIAPLASSPLAASPLAPSPLASPPLDTPDIAPVVGSTLLLASMTIIQFSNFSNMIGIASKYADTINIHDSFAVTKLSCPTCDVILAADYSRVLGPSVNFAATDLKAGVMAKLGLIKGKANTVLVDDGVRQQYTLANDTVQLSIPKVVGKESKDIFPKLGSTPDANIVATRTISAELATLKTISDDNPRFMVYDGQIRAIVSNNMQILLDVGSGSKQELVLGELPETDTDGSAVSYWMCNSIGLFKASSMTVRLIEYANANWVVCEYTDGLSHVTYENVHRTQVGSEYVL